jgi:hypothetical protein
VPSETPDPAEHPADGPVPLDDFAAPTALPSVLARGMAFASIIIASVCGGLVGFAVADLQCTGSCDGYGLITSGGTAIVAVLVLRAMSEWENQASVRSR